jgi:hypothetical protein
MVLPLSVRKSPCVFSGHVAFLWTEFERAVKPEMYSGFTWFFYHCPKKEPGHGFLEDGFLRNKFYKREKLSAGPVQSAIHGRRRRGRDGEGGNGGASEEQQSSGQY